MKERCYNPKFIGHKNYSDKGIKVCERWVNDFSAFLNDMGYKPSPKHSLDRIDGTKDYTPDNCRWATRVEQNTNRSMAHFITFDGKTMTVTQWAKYVGIERSTLDRRINHLHWTIEKSLTTPVK